MEDVLPEDSCQEPGKQERKGKEIKQGWPQANPSLRESCGERQGVTHTSEIFPMAAKDGLSSSCSSWSLAKSQWGEP